MAEEDIEDTKASLAADQQFLMMLKERPVEDRTGHARGQKEGAQPALELSFLLLFFELAEHAGVFF